MMEKFLLFFKLNFLILFKHVWLDYQYFSLKNKNNKKIIILLINLKLSENTKF